MKYFLVVLIALLGACISRFESTPLPYLPDAPISGAEAEEIFDYAYPLVLMQVTQDLMFTVPFRPESHPNQFIMFDELAKPKNQAVVLGNRNTLYCVGWVDLSKGPVVFEIPDMGNRYYVMPLLDAWTNTFRSLGSRTTGQKSQKYLLVNRAGQGEQVEGFETIVSPTNMVWITGRIQADSPEDAVAAARLQSQYRLTTYAQHTGSPDPFLDYEPDYAAWRVRKPVPYSLRMSAADFYNEFFGSWPDNPPAEEDAPILQLLAKVGIQSGGISSFDELGEPVRQQLSAALANKQVAYLSDFYQGKAQKTPWIYNTERMGVWRADYARRAYWAMWGLGANLVEDAVYGVSQLDDKLDQLHGADVYRLHFAAGETPPTSAFWSVTTYNNEGYLEKNSQDRYSLGSNHELTYNADGSLDIYMSHTRPDVEIVNWVPAPGEEFKVLLRIYWPQEEALSGAWSIPPIQKVGR
jgi:hypothetical protein